MCGILGCLSAFLAARLVAFSSPISRPSSAPHFTYGFFMTVTNKPALVHDILVEVRRFYRHEAIILYSDRSLDYSAMCRRFNCRFAMGSTKAGPWGADGSETIFIQRLRTALQHCHCDFLVRLEDDACLNGPLSMPPASGDIGGVPWPTLDSSLVSYIERASSQRANRPAVWGCTAGCYMRVGTLLPCLRSRTWLANRRSVEYKQLYGAAGPHFLVHTDVYPVVAAMMCGLKVVPWSEVSEHGRWYDNVRSTTTTEQRTPRHGLVHECGRTPTGKGASFASNVSSYDGFSAVGTTLTNWRPTHQNHGHLRPLQAGADATLEPLNVLQGGARNRVPGSLSNVTIAAGVEGIVVELVQWHAEVIPTSLAIVAALGARTGMVFTAKNHHRTFDVAQISAEWGLRPIWTQNETRLRSAITEAKVVLFQSAEYVPQQLLQFLPTDHHATVLLGCHNAAKCGPLYDHARTMPRTLVVHWFMREPSVLPYYMGPVRWPLSVSRRTLVPGAVQITRRNYSLLSYVPPERHVHLFGDDSARNLREIRERAYHPNISQHEGSFSTLTHLARSCTYIFAPVQSSYDAHAKMSSAVSLSVAYGLPIITRSDMLTALGLPGFSYDAGSHSEQLHAAFEAAFSAKHSTLTRMRRNIWSWREAHFARGILAIKANLSSKTRAKG